MNSLRPRWVPTINALQFYGGSTVTFPRATQATVRWVGHFKKMFNLNYQMYGSESQSNQIQVLHVTRLL
jgi:hypothetical protein